MKRFKMVTVNQGIALLGLPVAASVVPAAVLIALVMREEMMVLLTERTTQLSSHSGQIAFPGGKVDAQDADATAAALREAREVFEREYLVAQINRFGGNISRTAEFVGMERSALHRKLKSLSID
jgi:DNA-binding NtrC family response regulator